MFGLFFPWKKGKEESIKSVRKEMINKKKSYDRRKECHVLVMIKVEMIVIEITEVNKLMLLMRMMLLLLLMKGAGITLRVTMLMME